MKTGSEQGPNADFYEDVKFEVLTAVGYNAV
jgi:hypothetical protein